MNPSSKTVTYWISLLLCLPSKTLDSVLSAQAPQSRPAIVQPGEVFKFRAIGPVTNVGTQLSDERRWHTVEGRELAGRAVVSTMLDHVEIERVNYRGTGPTKVIVPLASFQESDRLALQVASPDVKPEARQLALLVPFAVEPQWSKAQPKIAKRYTRAIVVEANQVIFRFNNELYGVPKSAFTPASYATIADQFEAHAAGRYVRLTGSLHEVAGKLLLELDGDFLFEAIHPPLIPGSVLASGQRFRVPKHWMSTEQIVGLQQLIKRFPMPLDVSEPTAIQLPKIACLRLVDGALSYCEADPQDPQTVRSYQAVGRPSAEPLHKLANLDFVAIRRELIAASQPTLSGEQIQKMAFQECVAAGWQHAWWKCATGRAGFAGRIVGKIGIAYVFRQLDSPQPFYALPQQLSELDQQIAAQTTSGQSPDWAKEIDHISLFSKRLLMNHGRAMPVDLGETKIDVDSAFQGSIPVVRSLMKVDVTWPAIDLINIAEIERSRKFVAENKAILTARDSSKIASALERAFATSVSPDAIAVDKNSEGVTGAVERLPATNSSPPPPLVALPKLDHWKMINTSATFVGELVGQHGDDWVFAETVKGQIKYFMASPEILTPESRRVGQAALQKTKRRPWDELLTIADNWQHYRVWHDPTGKVRGPTNPAAVLSISESLIRFESLDGSHSSDRMPVDENQRQAVADYYQPAFVEATELQTRAEESLGLWKFRDCEPTLRAALVGESSEAVLVRSAKNVEFLISKACLDDDSLEALEQSRSFAKNLRTVSEAQEQTTARIWCARTELIGPATPVYLTFDERLEIVYPDGRHDFLNLSALTIREQLSFGHQWSKAQREPKFDTKVATAKDAATLTENLKKEIPSDQIVDSLPALRTEISDPIDANVTNWKHLTWSSTPTKLPATAKLLAINADARLGVIDEGSRGWAVVELATGKQKTIRSGANFRGKGGSPTDGATGASAQTALCWMFRDGQVYWIEDGKLKASGANTTESNTLTKLPLPIQSASQSTDFSSLVLQLTDSSTYRFDLATLTVKQLTPALDSRVKLPPPTLPNQALLPQDTSTAKPLTSAASVWASNDGTAVTAYSGNMLQFHVPAAKENDNKRVAFLATANGPLNVAASREAVMIQTNETGMLTSLAASITSPAPKDFGLPFNPSWFGIVKLARNPDEGSTEKDEELLQFVGKPADGFFDNSNYFFVHQLTLRGDYDKFAYQYVRGEASEKLRVAANGSAIVHLCDGRYVVSHRPPVIPITLRMVLYPIITRLVEQRDIGQLEALGRYLEQPKFQALGPYAGALARQFQFSFKIACYQYQPQLAGDRLERAFVLGDHLRRKYPGSQAAGNMLADIHRSLAWDARGDGFVDSVTEAGRAGFRSEMDKARALVDDLLNSPKPMAATFGAAIDVATATAQSLDGPRELAKRLFNSAHMANPDLHHSMAALLLPRWHGAPGMSEAYIKSVSARVPKELANEIYAQQVAMLMPMLGYQNPVTSQLQVDLETLFKGTKEYYEHRTDGDLLDEVILILAVEQKYEWVRELLKLRADKQMLPSSVAAANALSFRNVELNVKDRFKK